MNIGTDRILVTGATGQQGGAAARELLAAGHLVRAMTRHPEGEAGARLRALGAEVVAGDLDDVASLQRALDGAWGVFALQNSWEAGVELEEVQGKRLAQLARRAGVTHFVYSSVASADRKTGIPHFESKAHVEETVRAVDFPSFTILRPAFFMDNFASPWYKSAIEAGTLAVAMSPDIPLQMVAVADIGRYARLAFERHEELNGLALDFAGDAPTMAQAAELLSQAVGQPVAHLQVPLDEIRKSSADLALMFAWFERGGFDVDIEGNAARHGIAPTRFADWAGTVDWAPVGVTGGA